MVKKTFAILLDQDPDYCLEARGAYPRAGISLGLYKGSDLQVWTYENGNLKPARNQNLCINVARVNSQKPSGTNLQIHTRFSNNSPFQKWIYEDGLLKLQANIRNHESTTFCVDLRHNRIEEGQKIHLFEENGTTAQEWRLEPIDYEGEIEDSDEEEFADPRANYNRNQSYNNRRNDFNDDRMLMFAKRRGVPQKRQVRRMTKMDAMKLEEQNATGANDEKVENKEAEKSEGVEKTDTKQAQAVEENKESQQVDGTEEKKVEAKVIDAKVEKENDEGSKIASETKEDVQLTEEVKVSSNLKEVVADNTIEVSLPESSQEAEVVVVKNAETDGPKNENLDICNN